MKKFIPVVPLLALVLSSAATARKHSPPGTMVDVGGYRLHFDCTAPAEHTVVFEAGGGAFSLFWKPVQDLLADRPGIQICSYDRAGLGWSEPYPGGYRVEQRVQALKLGLERLGITDNLILVGASYGGFLIRLFAATYPESVRGLVYVDPNTVEFFDRYPDVVEKMATPERGFNSAPAWLVRKIARKRLHPSTSVLTESDLDTLVTLMSTKKHRRAQTEFGRAFQATVDTLREVQVPRHIESLVITRGQRFDFYPWTTEEREQAWRSAHLGLLADVDRGTHWIAEESGHAISFEQPELIVDAVVSMTISPTDSACGRLDFSTKKSFRSPQRGSGRER